ncbi:MAG: DUF4037 domain-containing protein [Oscillospiraceae bacterium]|nr:DUF4037 domain-containing protein [Oscillospiraceae bacterium]
MAFIDEARLLYEDRGREMIHALLPEYEGLIAVGLAGHGSECFGFDDGISRDHDFYPGFSVWIDDKTDETAGVEISRVYRAICGRNVSERSALADNARGVHRIRDFYSRYTGSAGAPETWEQWLFVPEYALAEASNGQVWRDDLGKFSREREIILNGMPEDVRKKKIAARAVKMAQSGQYNFKRCLDHGQEGAAALAIAEFVQTACSMIYLLNKKHMPYYKWAFKGMENLRRLGDMKDALEFLLTGEQDKDGKLIKVGVIEDICAGIIREMKKQHLTDVDSDYMEPHAFSVMEHIDNVQIRSLHVMEG